MCYNSAVLSLLGVSSVLDDMSFPLLVLDYTSICFLVEKDIEVSE